MSDGETNSLIILCFLVFFMSACAFAFSMSHMNVTSKGNSKSGTAAFEAMDLDVWEEKIAAFLRRIEIFHSLGKWLFGLGILLLLVAFAWYEFASDIWYEWLYRRMTK